MEHRTPDHPTTHVVLPDGPTIQVEATRPDHPQMPVLRVYADAVSTEAAVSITPSPYSDSELLFTLAEHARTWAEELDESARAARAVEDSRTDNMAGVAR